MFWDKISGSYDFFETVYNGKVYRHLGERVAEEIEETDEVLECACGTGAISRCIAPKCKSLVATDCSVKMLRQAWKKCRGHDNVQFFRADMTCLRCRDGRFDKVVAGNVLHLLPDPEAAVRELQRVCRPGGKLILPTYINIAAGTSRWAVRLLECVGASFKRQFDLDSYRRFFEDAGFPDARFVVVEGRMPCAIAVVTVGEKN